jgi:hypothetical protein
MEIYSSGKDGSPEVYVNAIPWGSDGLPPRLLHAQSSSNGLRTAIMKIRGNDNVNF